MDYLDELEEQARARFVRWDPALWREVTSGPARTLAAGLAAARAPAAQAEAIARSYLRLASEAIGLGYLFPASCGAGSFFTLAWMELLPRSLPALPPEAQARLLATAWNLAENLEGSPVWLRRIFHRLGARSGSLTDLEGLVAGVARRALGTPERRLGPGPRVAWVYLGDEDRRFLPGAVHFVAPTVACVHHRAEEPAAVAPPPPPAPAPAAAAAAATSAAPAARRRRRHGRAPEPAAPPAAPPASSSSSLPPPPLPPPAAPAIGVWLEDEPLVLGPMGCSEAPPPGDPGAPAAAGLLAELERRDPRAADRHAVALNPWRGAVTLETSQYLVALLPP